MLALKWTDIDEEGITVCPQKVENTTHKRLKIRLSNELKALLKTLPNTSPSIFTTRQDSPYTSQGFSSIWRRLMDRFVSHGGVRFTEHDLRGKVATDMNNVVLAQKLLGHAGIKMTEAYIKQRQTDIVESHTRKPK